MSTFSMAKVASPTEGMIQQIITLQAADVPTNFVPTSQFCVRPTAELVCQALGSRTTRDGWNRVGNVWVKTAADPENALWVREFRGLWSVERADLGTLRWVLCLMLDRVEPHVAPLLFDWEQQAMDIAEACDPSPNCDAAAWGVTWVETPPGRFRVDEVGQLAGSPRPRKEDHLVVDH